MPEMVRVKQKETGHELTVDAEWAEQFSEGYEVLADKEAVDAAGDPLPPKYKTTVSDEAAKKRAAAPATPKKAASSAVEE